MPRKKAHKSTFGSIEKRGENRYRIKWTDSNGIRQQENISGPRFMAEDRLAEIRLGLTGGRKSKTYQAFWDDTVLPSFEGLAERTISDYKYTWSKYLGPHIKDSRITDSDWKFVQQTINKMDTYSAQKKSFVLWKKIMNMAIRDKIIVSNPVDRSIKLMPHTPEEKKILFAEEIPVLLREIRGIKYEPVILCLIGGGLRPEEARALDYEDITPLEHRRGLYAVVRVNKAVVLLDGKAHEKDYPKNDNSNREVVIGRPFAKRLLSLVAGQSGKICKNRMGIVTSPSTMDHNWKTWCAKRDMKFVTMEEMRHSFSTALGEAGCADSLVRKQMGHTGKTVKERNYQQSTIRGKILVADMYTDLIIDRCHEAAES